MVSYIQKKSSALPSIFTIIINYGLVLLVFDYIVGADFAPGALVNGPTGADHWPAVPGKAIESVIETELGSSWDATPLCAPFGCWRFRLW
jgi:hypothetical protein